MRTLSKKTKYGLRALYNLTRRHGGGPVQIGLLAQEEEIPVKFLEAILLELKGAGILESRQGKKGGYQLSMAPGEVTLGSVIRSLEGPIAPLPCASETRYHPCEECEDVETCGTKMVMRQVRDAMVQILDSTTLASVVREIDRMKLEKRGGSELPMYYI
jgi:Rrf2 family protein